MVSGYAGTETVDAKVGRGPRAVAKSETRVSGGAGDSYTTIRDIV